MNFSHPESLIVELIVAHHRSVHDKLAGFPEKQLGSKGEKWIPIMGHTLAASRFKQSEHFKIQEDCQVPLFAEQCCCRRLLRTVLLLLSLFVLLPLFLFLFSFFCWGPSTRR